MRGGFKLNVNNKILNFLFSENAELMNKYISIPALIIEIYLALLLFTNLFHIKSTLKQKISYILACFVGGLFSNTFIPSPFNAFFNYILFFILIKIIFKMSTFKTLISVVFPIFLIALINILLVKPYLLIFKIKYSTLLSVPFYRISFLVITYLLVYLISLFIKSKKIDIFDNIILDKKNLIVISANLLFCLLLICLEIVIFFYYVNIIPFYIAIFVFISLFAYSFINIYSLIKSLKINRLTQKLQNAEEYNKNLSDLYDEVKGFKHDFENITNSIGGYISTSDIDGLKKYFSSLEIEFNKTHNVATLNPKLVNNPGIYSLLNAKFYKAEKEGITLNLEFLIDLNELNIDIYEFSRILGILIDNAIEAAKECTNKIINIKFRNEYNQCKHVIIVNNTFKNKNLDLNKIFEKNYSEKKEHSGLGLYEVRKYINKHKNLKLLTSKNEEYFSQTLEIYYSNNFKIL